MHGSKDTQKPSSKMSYLNNAEMPAALTTVALLHIGDSNVGKHAYPAWGGFDLIADERAK